ncbi:MAG: 5-deoxy-glucuronate isomerase [Candidatus Methylomirabilales bacterium]
MPDLIRRYDNKNHPIVTPRSGVLNSTYFNLVRLREGEAYQATLDGLESLYAVLSGNVDLEVGGAAFRDVGRRPDIWSGNADSVYVPAGAPVRVRANADGTEVAVAGGVCDKVLAPFRVLPGEVDMVNVGSVETRSHRRIFHLLGQNGVGRAGNLLVSELYCDHGCWSGYPPHKHDEDRGRTETAHEELYHYRFRPETGFGAQLCFQPDGTATCFMTRHGDTFLLDRGYHPTVTSPGHEEYIFTILVGRTQRGLVQHFKEDYGYLMRGIPGIQDMVDKFK